MVADRTSTTVDEHLDQLDPERRPQAEALRRLVLDHLQPGFEEMMLWGMPSYVVPLDRFDATSNGQPLTYVSFAVQKNYDAIYLLALDAGSALDVDFRQRWAGSKKLNMGRCCVRFKALADADVALLGETIGACSVDGYIALHQAR